jgi:hypothetical protein
MASTNFKSSIDRARMEVCGSKSQVKTCPISEELTQWCPFRKSNTRDRATHYFFLYSLKSNNLINNLAQTIQSFTVSKKT